MENFELDNLSITREVAELFGTNDFMLEALPR
jgi:hypothetical protein